jgi:hypothetical protein
LAAVRGISKMIAVVTNNWRSRAMAKEKDKVNRSEAIRQVLLQDPNFTTKEVVEKLKEQGIRVQANLVYFVRAQMKQRKQIQQPEIATAKRTNPVNLIIKVKALAEETGGIKVLKQLVDVLAP